MTLFPFWKQEQPESCVPACVRIILASHNIVRSEAEIYQCCETDVDGTLPSAAARCIRSFGLPVRSERLSRGIEALRTHLSNSQAIVYINLAPLLGVQTIHAVIVASIQSQEGLISVIDPSFLPNGQRRWSIGLFEIG